MKRKIKNEDYVYNAISKTYQEDGYSAAFIAIQQALYYDNFENFVNDHHETDKLLKYLNVGYEEFTNKYGSNVSFLLNLCEEYVKLARSNSRKNTRLEEIVSKEGTIQENMAYALFTKIFNATFLEEPEISEIGMDRDLKRYRRTDDYDELSSNLLSEMYMTFCREIEKEKLLNKVQVKSFYRNTAQNLRMIFNRKKRHIISGIKSSKKFEEYIEEEKNKDGEVNTKKDYKKTYKKRKKERSKEERYEEKRIKKLRTTEDEVHVDVGKRLHAVSTIGMERKNQEDVALITEHPDNPNLKSDKK